MPKAEPQVGDWVVLYGSLMRGLGAMDELGIGNRLRYVGPCTVMGELFDLGRFPGMRHGDGQVIAEIHALLAAEVIEVLDEFEGYSAARPRESLYLREAITLIAPSGVEAWVYTYNEVPDASMRITSGDWRAHLSERVHE